MEKETSTSALAEGALFAVICAVLSLARIYLAPIGIILTFFCPLPIIFLVIRNNLKIGILSVLVATLLVNFFSNPFDAVMVLTWSGLVGVIFGEAIKRNLSASKIIIWGAVASIIGILIFIFLTTIFLHFNPLNKISLEINQMTEEMIKHYKNKEKEIEILKQISVVLPKLFPFFIFLISLMLSYLYFLTTDLTLKRIGYSIPSLPPFNLWRSPSYLVWGFILGKTLTFFKINPEYFLFYLAINIDFIFTFIFFIFGISIMTFFMDKYKFPKILRGIIYLLSSLFLSMAIYWLGALDIFFNFRKIKSEEIT